MDARLNSRDRITRLLECPICIGRYELPKQLPCQHTFCLKCITQVYAAKSLIHGILSCPICKKKYQFKTKASNPKQKKIIPPKAEELRQYLHANRTIQDLLDIQLAEDMIREKPVESTSKVQPEQPSETGQVEEKATIQNVDKICTSCGNGGSWWCKTCDKTICIRCLGGHLDKFPAHELFEEGEELETVDDVAEVSYHREDSETQPDQHESVTNGGSQITKTTPISIPRHHDASTSCDSLLRGKKPTTTSTTQSQSREDNTESPSENIVPHNFSEKQAVVEAALSHITPNTTTKKVSFGDEEDQMASSTHIYDEPSQDQPEGPSARSTSSDQIPDTCTSSWTYTPVDGQPTVRQTTTISSPVDSITQLPLQASSIPSNEILAETETNRSTSPVYENISSEEPEYSRRVSTIANVRSSPRSIEHDHEGNCFICLNDPLHRGVYKFDFNGRFMMHFATAQNVIDMAFLNGPKKVLVTLNHTNSENTRFPHYLQFHDVKSGKCYDTQPIESTMGKWTRISVSIERKVMVLLSPDRNIIRMYSLEKRGKYTVHQVKYSLLDMCFGGPKNYLYMLVRSPKGDVGIQVLKDTKDSTKFIVPFNTKQLTQAQFITIDTLNRLYVGVPVTSSMIVVSADTGHVLDGPTVKAFGITSPIMLKAFNKLDIKLAGTATHANNGSMEPAVEIYIYFFDKLNGCIKRSKIDHYDRML